MRPSGRRRRERQDDRRRREDGAPSHVLVALDGSPLADDALEVFDCSVTVVNVVTPLDVEMGEGSVLEPDEGRLEATEDRAAT